MNKATIFVLLAALLSAGCSAAYRPPANASTNIAATANSGSKTSPSAQNTSKPDLPTSSITGIPPCDEYLNRVEYCLTKVNVPDELKSSYRQSMEQNRAAWKQAAATESGKKQLDSSCQMALDAAESFFESCK
jgi:hypothetical protein